MCKKSIAAAAPDVSDRKAFSQPFWRLAAAVAHVAQSPPVDAEPGAGQRGALQEDRRGALGEALCGAQLADQRGPPEEVQRARLWGPLGAAAARDE